MVDYPSFTYDHVCRLVLSLPIPSFKECTVGLYFTHANDYACWLSYLCLSSVEGSACPIFAHPSARRTFWQRIGQPYAYKSGRCFVAVVDIEANRCAVCLAELDAVQSEADRQADVCARRLSGRVGGQATNNLPTKKHYKQ